jgi:hypothetical protein
VSANLTAQKLFLDRVSPRSDVEAADLTAVVTWAWRAETCIAVKGYAMRSLTVTAAGLMQTPGVPAE